MLNVMGWLMWRLTLKCWKHVICNSKAMLIQGLPYVNTTHLIPYTTQIKMLKHFKALLIIEAATSFLPHGVILPVVSATTEV